MKCWKPTMGMKMINKQPPLIGSIGHMSSGKGPSLTSMIIAALHNHNLPTIIVHDPNEDQDLNSLDFKEDQLIGPKDVKSHTKCYPTSKKKSRGKFHR